MLKSKIYMASYLTREGLEKLKKELDYLENTKRKEVSERIRHTAAQGDLKENAAYDMAKDEQGFVEARIRELKGIIAGSQIFEAKHGGSVGVGSVVFLESDEGEEQYQLVGPEEADILSNKISFQSPLGKALLGKKIGDKAIVQLPETKKEYKITKVR